MRRMPNPWIAIPSLLAGALAAWLGGTVTAVSCRVQESDGTITTCPGWTTAIAVFSFLTVTISVAVVLVLVYRSLAEWQEQRSRS